MSDDKRKKKKKSTAAPLTYKESILISKKSFHQLLTGKKKRLAAADDDETGDMRWKQTKKKIVWDDDDNGLPKGEVDLLPWSHNHTSSSAAAAADMGETSQGKRRRNNKSISELMSMLPARPDRATHHFVAWLSTVGADWIDWDEDTFQVIKDSVRKNNSSLGNILTFLEDEEPIGNKMFATLHTTGDFRGILMGTTHFIDVVSQELYSDGFIEQTPFDEDRYKEHVKELAGFLKKNYGMFPDKIKQVMDISLEVRKKMEAKAEEEQKPDRTKREKAAIKEVMRKVREEEEKKTREEVGKKIRKGQSK